MPAGLPQRQAANKRPVTKYNSSSDAEPSAFFFIACRWMRQGKECLPRAYLVLQRLFLPVPGAVKPALTKSLKRAYQNCCMQHQQARRKRLHCDDSVSALGFTFSFSCSTFSATLSCRQLTALPVQNSLHPNTLFSAD